MFLEPKIVAVKALQLLKENLVLKQLVNRDYESSFRKVGDTISVRKRIQGNSQLFDGAIDGKTGNEVPVTITLDRHRDFSTILEPKDETLNIVDFTEQVIAPAIRSIVEGVEEDIASYIVSKASERNTIAFTPNPTDLSNIAKMGKILDKAKAPMDARSLVLSVDHKYDYALTPNLSEVNRAGDNQALREARLGKVYTMDTYYTQAMPSSKADVAGDETSFKINGSKGNAFVALSNVAPASANIKAGDCFIYDNHVYYFTEAQTAGSGNVSRIAIDRKLHKTTSGAEGIIVCNKPVSVAFQKDAIAFVNAPLANPQGAVKSYTAQADGLAIRVVYGYDLETKEDTISFDVLYGFGELRPELIAKLQ